MLIAGNRPGVPDIAIVVTDGKSSSSSATAAEAKKLRDAGVTVLAIGVGRGISKPELNSIATDPDSTHVFAADNSSILTIVAGGAGCDEMAQAPKAAVTGVGLDHFSSARYAAGTLHANATTLHWRLFDAVDRSLLDEVVLTK